MLGLHQAYYLGERPSEGQYSVYYYLSEGNKVVRAILSEWVTAADVWTDPDWNADKEPNHSTLKRILSTIRFIE